MSPNQIDALKVKPFFEWFKECMDILKNKDITLAIIAEGIDSQPEWVEYIKQHPEWNLQVHAWEHRTMTRLSDKQFTEHISKAKQKILDTFGVAPTRYFPPKLKWTKNTHDLADNLGLREDHGRYRPIHWFSDHTINEIYIHFWNANDLKLIKQI
jgi:peptidoglycan/xylan/chitin deacetylase (PgdA/CDA1 family)